MFISCILSIKQFDDCENSKLNHLIYECNTKEINDVEHDDYNAIECSN